MHDGSAGVVSDRDRLVRLREEIYRCLRARADALFEIVDALAGADRRVRSVAELMLESPVRRGWGGLYQALQHGVVDVEAVRDLLAARVVDTRAHGPVLFAVDVSKYPRPDTRYVPDVGWQYDAARDRGEGSPAVAGWAMQWVAQVGLDPGQPRSSWCLPMDVRRVPTAGNANDLAAEQIAALAARLARTHPGLAPMFLFDAGYCPIFLTQRLPVGAQILVRLRGDRVFFAAPPPRSANTVGRPRKHGDRFALDEPDTWPIPDVTVERTRPDTTRVLVRAWHRMHPEPRQRRKWVGTDIVEGTLVRRDVHHTDGRVQTWWLWWAGPAAAFDAADLADAYRHRFTIEHHFRFDKQDLSWTGYTPLHPDQAERWSWLIALAYTQLWHARALTADHRLPWEKPCPPAHLSPRRVRRGFRQATADLPTPTNPPKPSRPGPGRPRGSKNITTRPRQPVIKKGRPANTGHPKGRSPQAKTNPDP